jgi:hypothetical protein
MADDPDRPPGPDTLGGEPPPPPFGGSPSDAAARDRDGGISDFVRRAVAAGLEAAGGSKEAIVRIATNEIRDWLDRLELDTELRKALSKMVLEVKAEIRFRPAEGEKLTAEAKTDVHVRRGPRG